MEPNHNGYSRPPILAVTTVGIIGLVGVIAICLVDPDDAIVLSGIVGGIVTSLIGFLMLLSGQKRQEGQTQQLVIQTNSIVESLIEAAKKGAFDAGVLAEREAEEGRAKVAAKASRLSGDAPPNHSTVDVNLSVSKPHNR
jgi:ABC-type enterobactin transport system permease subunit